MGLKFCRYNESGKNKLYPYVSFTADKDHLLNSTCELKGLNI